MIDAILTPIATPCSRCSGVICCARELDSMPCRTMRSQPMRCAMVMLTARAAIMISTNGTIQEGRWAMS
jgi:hypothetical protein